MGRLRDGEPPPFLDASKILFPVQQRTCRVHSERQYQSWIVVLYELAYGWITAFYVLGLGGTAVARHRVHDPAILAHIDLVRLEKQFHTRPERGIGEIADFIILLGRLRPDQQYLFIAGTALQELGGIRGTQATA